MRARLITAGLAALMLTAVADSRAAAQATEDTTALPAELRAARATMATAYARLDATAAASHFAADGAVDFQGQVFTGPDAIAGWFVEAFSGVTALRIGTARFTIGEAEVTERVAYIVVLPDGQEQGGTSESVWKRQEDGSWKVASLIVM